MGQAEAAPNEKASTPSAANDIPFLRIAHPYPIFSSGPHHNGLLTHRQPGHYERSEALSDAPLAMKQKPTDPSP
jgi:hypothetical protein